MTKPKIVSKTFTASLDETFYRTRGGDSIWRLSLKSRGFYSALLCNRPYFSASITKSMILSLSYHKRLVIYDFCTYIIIEILLSDLLCKEDFNIEYSYSLC